MSISECRRQPEERDEDDETQKVQWRQGDEKEKRDQRTKEIQFNRGRPFSFSFAPP